MAHFWPAPCSLTCGLCVCGLRRYQLLTQAEYRVCFRAGDPSIFAIGSAPILFLPVPFRAVSAATLYQPLSRRPFAGAISGEMQVIASICGLSQVRLSSFFWLNAGCLQCCCSYSLVYMQLPPRPFRLRPCSTHARLCLAGSHLAASCGATCCATALPTFTLQLLQVAAAKV